MKERGDRLIDLTVPINPIFIGAFRENFVV